MKKNALSLLMVAVVLSLLLSACNKPASTPPVTPTGEGAFPFPVETEGLFLEDLQTQTAQAGGQPSEQATPKPTKEQKAVKPTATAVPEEAEAAVAIPTLSRPSTYTLKKGEFPYCIARRYDLDVASLLSANGLTVDSKPPVGFVLTIPATGNWSSGSRARLSHPTTYTVAAGDTIYTIACAFGDVSPQAIAAANGLSSPYNLEVGQVLDIP